MVSTGSNTEGDREAEREGRKERNALGYRLPPRLLMISAQTSMIRLDTIISGTYHHPILATCGIVTACSEEGKEGSGRRAGEEGRGRRGEKEGEEAEKAKEVGEAKVEGKDQGGIKGARRKTRASVSTSSKQK